MKNKSFEERAKEARKIIKLRFAGSKSLTNDNDWAELIALHTVGWGGLERQINASQIKKVKRATNILEKLIDSIEHESQEVDSYRTVALDIFHEIFQRDVSIKYTYEEDENE